MLLVIDKGKEKEKSLVVIDKGKKPLDRTSSDVVEKVWHQVKGKSKGKSMNMQYNSLPTTTWKGN